MSTLFYSLFAVGVVTSAIGFVVQFIWLARMKRQHADIWHRLGQPPWKNTSGTMFPVWKFLLRKEYRALPDPTTKLLAASLRTVVLIMMPVYSVFVVLVIRELFRELTKH